MNDYNAPQKDNYLTSFKRLKIIDVGSDNWLYAPAENKLFVADVLSLDVGLKNARIILVVVSLERRGRISTGFFKEKGII